MVAANKIQACAQRVTEEFHPEKIVLFGSYVEKGEVLYETAHA